MMDERASGSQAGISGCPSPLSLSLSFFLSIVVFVPLQLSLHISLNTAAAVVSCLVLPKPREQLYIAGRPEREIVACM
jgi:hypothetical protein